MLRSMHELENYAIGATDGDVGHVKDFYFDDDTWVIRYLVVATGSWLMNRDVLISPISVHNPDWAGRTLPVSITKEQVRNSPDIDTEKPVSRQHEMRYLGYYGYPYYWGGRGMWGAGMYPYAMYPGYDYGASSVERAREEEIYARTENERHRNDDPRLRSCKAVVGYHIHATDGHIGHVEGMLVDEETWAVRYLVVNTSNWWMGHKVLIAPQWVTAVDWSGQSVSVDLSRGLIQDGPVYDPDAGTSRQQELSLYQHFGRTGYWADDARRETEISRV